MSDSFNEGFKPNERLALGLVGGLLLGGLAGAGTVLLLAPQSGRRTRAQLRRQGRRLRAQTVARVNSVAAQAQASAKEFRDGMADKAEELQQRAQTLAGQAKERLNPEPKAGYLSVKDKG